jgi:hypothetical protein
MEINKELEQSFGEINKALVDLQDKLQDLTKKTNNNVVDANLGVTIMHSAKIGNVNLKYLEFSTAFMEYATFLDRLLAEQTKGAQVEESSPEQGV